jgi:hypothetical protein
VSEHRQEIARLINLQKGERVLKAVSTVRVGRSVGLLVLTHFRLFHIINKNTVNELAQLSNIESVERTMHRTLIPPGHPALRISLYQPREKPVSASRRPSLSLRDSFSRESNSDLVLIFLSDRNAWFYFIKEMAVAHQLAKVSVDGDSEQIINEAVCNITLLEAVGKVELNSSVKRTTVLLEDEPDKVPALLRFCQPEKKVSSVLPSTMEMFVRRIDPCPNNVTKPTVECLAYLPHTNLSGVLWCGLASGYI